MNCKDQCYIAVSHKKKALTFLELLITVSLAGVLLTIAICSFDMMIREQNLQTSANQIIAAYDTARYIAEKSGIQTDVILTPNTGKYSITSNGEIITNNSRYGAISGEFPDTVKILNNQCGQLGFDVNGSLIQDPTVPLNSDCHISIGYSNNISKNLTLRIATGSIDYE